MVQSSRTVPKALGDEIAFNAINGIRKIYEMDVTSTFIGLGWSSACAAGVRTKESALIVDIQCYQKEDIHWNASPCKHCQHFDVQELRQWMSPTKGMHSRRLL